MEQVRLILSSCKRGAWLNDIVRIIEDFDSSLEGKEVTLILPKDIDPDKLEPFHIVLLACFLEHLHRLSCSNVKILTQNKGLIDVMREKLKMHKYYTNEASSHEDSEDSTILNLWKVIDSKTYEYSLSITKYFNNNFFNGLDTSGLTSALNEVYANIADHSQSNGNAFSYIWYDTNKNKIYVAACDFGLGIATTLKKSNRVYKNDQEALIDSLNIGVTAKSTKGNKGMGLDNILSTITEDDIFKIVSNKALLACWGNKNNIKTYPLDFEFKGTLIYFELSTKSFPLKDMEDEVMIN